MEIVRGIGGGLLCALGAWIIVFNFVALLGGEALRRRSGRNTSLVPLVGGVLVCAALLVVPFSGARAWWWIPFVLDPGCALMCGGGAIVALSRRWREGSESP